MNNHIDGRQTTRCKRIMIYITSGFSFFVYMGLMGVISRLKKPMGDELHLPPSYLGLIDGLKFIARSLGCLFLLFHPPRYPKRNFLIASVITAVAFNLIAASVLFPQISQTIVAVCMLVAGFSRSYCMVPLLIINQYFDSKDADKKIVAALVAFGALGNAFSIIFCEVLLSNLKFNWSICIFLYTLLFLILLRIQ